MVVTKPSFNTTDLPLDLTTFEEDLEIPENPDSMPHASGIYDYESSLNFDNYLQVRVLNLLKFWNSKIVWL